jgi:hypothetical protein
LSNHNKGSNLQGREEGDLGDKLSRPEVVRHDDTDHLAKEG